jgi:hypothetical protein
LAGQLHSHALAGHWPGTGRALAGDMHWPCSCIAMHWPGTGRVLAGHLPGIFFFFSVYFPSTGRGIAKYSTVQVQLFYGDVKKLSCAARDVNVFLLSRLFLAPQCPVYANGHSHFP